MNKYSDYSHIVVEVVSIAKYIIVSRFSTTQISKHENYFNLNLGNNLKATSANIADVNRCDNGPTS